MNPPSSAIDPDALEAGVRLAEFEIERVLGIGGFGIVYLAFDHALERHVALKEYMPAALAARRGGGTQIAARSQAHVATFGVGLRSFVNEARLLARFDHPALVKVYRFWEENGTAYMVMPYYDGQTLGSARAAMASPPNEAWLLALADAILGALQVLHREQVYHRDVAPDNIMLLPDGTAVLLDFGAARHVIGDRTQAVTAILKPNFAPIEQYGDSAPLRQGPWSDVYSLGAVLHFCIVGRAPVPAALRVLHDELPSLLALREEWAASDGSHYSPSLLAAIDAALAVRPEARPQHAAAFRAALRGESPPPPAMLVALATPASASSQREHARAAFALTEARPRRVEVAAAVTTAWATLGPDTDLSIESVAPPKDRAASAAAVGVLSKVGARPWRFAALGLAAMAAAGMLGYASTRSEEPVATSVQSATPPTAVASAADAPAASTALQVAAPAVADAPSAPVRVVAVPPPARDAAPPKVAVVQKPMQRTARPAPRPAMAASATDDTPQVASAPSPRAEPAERSRSVAALTARESCGERNFFSMQFCLQRQCGKPEFAQDGECVMQRERQAMPSF